MAFIAVHCGAGFMKSEEKYRKILNNAVSAGYKVLEDGGTALDAVTAAVEVFENDGITNCGHGSALNLEQEVQCDASLMQSVDLNWAGIACVSKLKNPIKAARCLLLNQKTKHPDHLMHPCFLTGKGARKWAVERGCLESDDLVTDTALDLFEKHRFEISKFKEEAINLTVNEQFRTTKRMKLESSGEGSSKRHDSNQVLLDHGYSLTDTSKTKLDTVGAVAVDKFGNLASAGSSGGIMFKDKGRIGQAAVYGAGVWSEENVSVTTSGVGEYLIKTVFAKKCASKLLKSFKQKNQGLDQVTFDEVIKKAIEKDFIGSRYLKSTDHDKLVGVLGIVAEPKEKRVRLIVGHNTPSMFVAYESRFGIENIFSKLDNHFEKDDPNKELGLVKDILVDY